MPGTPIRLGKTKKIDWKGIAKKLIIPIRFSTFGKVELTQTAFFVIPKRVSLIS